MTNALPSPAQDPFISTTEICEILHCAPVTVWRRRKAGDLPPVKRRDGRVALHERKAFYEKTGIEFDESEAAKPTTDPWIAAIAQRTA